MLLNSWRSVGVLVFTSPSTAQSIAIPYQFQQRIIKIATRATATAKLPIKSSWYRSGYLEQRIGIQQVTRRSVPLNQETVFVLPLLQPYRLFFKPVPWLPNLRVQFYVYTGVEDADLLEEASRI